MYKKLLLVSVLLIAMPLVANAQSQASATINNISLTTIYGPGFTFGPSSYGTTTNYASDDNITYDEASGYDSTPPVSLSTSAGTLYSSSASTVSGFQSLTAFADTGSGNSYGAASFQFNVNYIANTLLYFSSDSSINGTTSVFGSASSSVRIAVTNLTDPSDSHIYIESFINGNKGAGDFYSESTNLHFYFYDTQDHNLFFGVNIQAIAGEVPLAPVPEPETYAMLLAGLGIVGFVARRKS